MKEAPAVRGKGRGEAAFFKVTCKVLSRQCGLCDENIFIFYLNYFALWIQDNGRGMPHDDIPNMLGRGKS